MRRYFEEGVLTHAKERTRVRYAAAETCTSYNGAHRHFRKTVTTYMIYLEFVCYLEARDWRVIRVHGRA